jgi:ADP-ribosylglycohydrolase
VVVELPDRVVGCVVGLALGDALGAPFEGRWAHEIPHPVPALEVPRGDRLPGTTTDDTAMARNLVRSLAERGGLDEEDLAARHVQWFLTLPPDVGSLTRRVLTRAARGEPAAAAARAVWEERGPEVSAGNGSVMYCAPLGAAYAHRPGRLLELAPRLSALTHFDGRCGTAVLAVTLAVAALVRGEDRDRATANALGAVIGREGGEELEYLAEAVGQARPVDGPDMGFCLFTAAVGLQALLRGGGFEPALRRVVAMGGDTDTNAAVAGALLGSAVGATGLPAAWRLRLQDREAIEEEALGLVPLAKRSED